MISGSMKACLQSAVDGIRRCMPEGTDLSEWFLISPTWGEDPVEDDDHIWYTRVPSELRYWVGYINGAADIANMTPIELLDSVGIDFSNEGDG